MEQLASGHGAGGVDLNIRRLGAARALAVLREDEMVDAMVKLEVAAGPYLKALSG
jgi:hypothetical protein